MISLRRQVLSLKPAGERAEVTAAIAAVRRGEEIPREQWLALSFLDRARIDMERPGHMAKTKEKAERKLARLDAWPPDIRECVHRQGYEVVLAFWDAGVREARLIDHLIRVVKGDMQPFGNKRMSKR